MRKFSNPILATTDLEEILHFAKSDYLQLKNKRIFISGGTGFIGKWFIQALMQAHYHFNLNLQIMILTRSVADAISKNPWLNQDYIKFIEGDTRSFEFPELPFDVIIHGAVAASAKLNSDNPEEMVRTCTEGTYHILKFADQCGAKQVLLLSSGAVYGKQFSEITHIDETSLTGPDILNPGNAYHEGKRMSELLGAIWAKRSGYEFKVARCFAFVGPYLPLDTHFAVGNFIADCLKNRTIEIKGDGSSYRSLLYGTDLVICLMRILINGKSCRAYNVGSDYNINIRTMAQYVDKIAEEFFPQRRDLKDRVIIYGKSNPESPIERYVPSISRIKNELNISITINLEEALRRTFRWYINEA